MARIRARCLVEATLLESLRDRGFGPESPIAVAYSGGPDSTALLAALCSLGWAHPIAVHVDHGIRPRAELDEELALVKSNCSGLGVHLVVAHVRGGAIAERAEENGEGIEAEARRYRYRVFKSALDKTGASVMLLAHNRDDQLETVLMRLMGGSGSAGLRGIPVASGPFLRPFLGIEKAQLLAYAESKALRYSLDSTNASSDYLRNRVRRELVPFLDSRFPGWRRGLDRAARKAGMDEEALNLGAEALRLEPGERGTLSSPDVPLVAAPAAVGMRVLVDAGSRLAGKGRLSSDLALSALEVLKRGEGASYSGGGLVFSRREGRVELRYGLDFPSIRGYFVLIDRPRRVRVGKLEVNAAWRSSSCSADGVQGIRADAFRFPLVVRSRRPGDSIVLPGGTKRLDALFSEWALPEEARARVPLVEDRDGIVAVLGSRLGGEDRYRRGPSGDCDRRLRVSVKGA
jgi:tRNA(Ile)-lysidine synthetase-like protein